MSRDGQIFWFLILPWVLTVWAWGFAWIVLFPLFCLFVGLLFQGTGVTPWALVILAGAAIIDIAGPGTANGVFAAVIYVIVAILL